MRSESLSSLIEMRAVCAAMLAGRWGFMSLEYPEAFKKLRKRYDYGLCYNGVKRDYWALTVEIARRGWRERLCRWLQNLKTLLRRK